MTESTELIERLKASDDGAYQEIFQMHYKFLVYLAYQYIGDDHFSRDIVQEVFLDIWRRRHKLDITNLKAFLKRAVINKCLTTIRNGKRIDYVEAINENEANSNRLDVPYEFIELQKTIKSLVDQLPERCRLIFKMSRQENLSHKEIAAKLNISTKTIENQVSKALRILRTELKKLGLMYP